jgi:hypothetical protein
VNIKYRKLPDVTRSEGYEFYPLLRISLRHNTNLQYVLALVDSGSVDCVFPASIAELLCIDIRSGQLQNFHGFDLAPVKGYIHRLHLQIAGFTQCVAIDAVFIESEGMAILGQRRFFEAIKLFLSDGPGKLKSIQKLTL